MLGRKGNAYESCILPVLLETKKRVLLVPSYARPGLNHQRGTSPLLSRRPYGIRRRVQVAEGMSRGPSEDVSQRTSPEDPVSHHPCRVPPLTSRYCVHSTTLRLKEQMIVMIVCEMTSSCLTKDFDPGLAGVSRYHVDPKGFLHETPPGC